MNIHDIQCRTVTTGFELQAQISEGSKVHPVWFRWPGPTCPTPGDVFLLLGLLPAMTIGGQLRIEETVSERLFQALASIQKFFLKLDPALHAVEVVPQGVCSWPAPSSGLPEGKACTFTGGVDSFYSTLLHLPELQHLIFIHGYDIPLSQNPLRTKVSSNLRHAAEQLNKPLIEIETNLRDFSDRYVNWELLFGAAVAAVGILLSGAHRLLYFPSSFSSNHLIECGSHPHLDPLFRTERVEMIHDASDVTRSEKIASISRNPIAMRTLRVCWENRNGAYNCGQCEKCLRTLVALRLAGALDRCSTFPSSVNLTHLLSIADLHILVRPLWFENLSVAVDKGTDPDLIAALKQRVRRSYPWHYLLWRLQIRGHASNPPSY